ncbi:MAG: methyltransferase [Bacteroidetes bacterium]|nr:MAG: methyltransferase [Bacteroidota bacterium]
MPNPYFQFKQFTVQHDQCAMKVCTDSCILGAWFAQKIRPHTFILDVGAGSGVLMLMLAQKIKSQIHGIELDLASFRQLKENINHCNWKDKMRIFIGDARTFVFPEKYDFIISNPPFYENDLKSPDERLNIARHANDMTLADLLSTISANLTKDGSFGILLPYKRTEEFEKLALKKGFHLSEKLFVRQSPKHNFFRSILHFTRLKVDPVASHELTIQGEAGKYSPEFVDLLKDYYLHL